MKKTVSVLLAFLFLFGLLGSALTAAAEEGAEIVDSGYCGGEGDGKNLTWTLDSDGLLTISGTGDMAHDHFPWSMTGRRQFTRIVIKDGVTSVGRRAFSGCNNLTEVTFGSSLKKIWGYSFSSCTKLSSVTFPASLEAIDGQAFSGCTGISSIYIPAGVTSLNSTAFSGCTSVADVTVAPENPAYTNDDNGAVFSKDKTKLIFYPCGNPAETYDVPSTVTAILSWAFSGSVYLKSVTIPDSVTLIDYGAFAQCKALVDVSIGNGVKTIGNYAFTYSDNLKNVTFGNALESMGHSAFASTKISSFVLPASFHEYGVDTFGDCRDIEYFYVDPENRYYSTDEHGVLFNKDKTKLIRYNTGSPAETYAIPETVTGLELGAFECASHLKTVDLANVRGWLPSNAFSHCTALTSIVIPDTVVGLSVNVFPFCSALTEIYIPASFLRIDSSSFYDCGSLRDVYYAGSQEDWENIVIENLNDGLLAAEIHYNWHEHVPGEPVIENVVPATCAAAGSYEEAVYCVRCDYEFSRTVKTEPALAHTPGAAVRENEVPATCTAAGGYDTVIYCVNCPAELSRTHVEIPARGHVWGEWEVVKPATAEEEGLMRRVCANDPDHAEEEVIPKLQPQTSAFQQFIARIRDFFNNIIDWFGRLFSF